MGASLLQQAIEKCGGLKSFLASLTHVQLAELPYEWQGWARSEQLPPSGDWRVWLYLAGRGSGKTRAGAEWVRSLAEKDPRARIALIAPTAADARDIMIEGVSGIMAICPPWDRPHYEPSKRRITWRNGAIAIAYSAEEADRLRGPQHSHAWCDELCSWPNDEYVWDMLMFGLRLGNKPCSLVTTTPRPTDLVRRLVKARGTLVVKGSTYDNIANLPPTFVDEIRDKYEGTRLGRQEIHAELLDDVEGALWNHGLIEKLRRHDCPLLTRIVVGVDPSGSAKKTADTCGIVVAGLGECHCLGRRDVHAFVLEDLSGRYDPATMGDRAIAAYHKYKAHRVVIEDNFGGKLTTDVLSLIDKTVATRSVHAKQGKRTRAEPVAALYEKGRVHHVGLHKALEDELCQYAPLVSVESPGRMDALVWALTDLMLGESRASFGTSQFKSPGFTFGVPSAEPDWND